jgi:PAS domain S-box-containing protein
MLESDGNHRRRPIRLLVAEDDEALRAAICELIVGEDGLELAGVAADADEAIARAAVLKPQIALLDVRMPGGGGSRAAREIRRVSPGTRSIALSAYDDRSNVLEMLRAGAVGYLVKGGPPDEIVDAVRRAARDQSSMPAALVAELVGDLTRESAQKTDADEAVRRSETRFRSLLESAPDGVVIIDENGCIVLVNEQAERLFGYRREELVGQGIEMLLPQRFRGGHLRLRGGYFSHPSTRPMGAGLDLAGLRKEGTEFPVDISLSAIETAEGRLGCAFIRDVTERKAIEVARRKTEERFERLLESAPDAVVIVDSDGRIVLVNTQTERLFGYGRSELLNEPVEVLLPERFQARHVGHRNTYLSDPRTRPMGAGLRLAGRRKDGSEFAVDISLSGIETEKGRLAAAFVRDVTDREARVALDRAIAERRAVLAHLVSAGEEERRRIATDIHDDSIQVMTAAGMRLQILRGALDSPEQLRRLSELEQTIQLSISRLRHLIFELRPPALDNEGLSAALRAYLDEVDEITPTSYGLDDRLVVQPSEATRVILYRIAQEVLTNIRKHAGAENATVTLEESDGGYRIRIRDDGVGFTPESAGPRPGHLGVAAIRERAELAGGWLQIESAPGQGTAVDFWIPAYTAGSAQSTTHQSGTGGEA